MHVQNKHSFESLMCLDLVHGQFQQPWTTGNFVP